MSELIKLSGNQRTNVPLPDDDLIAQYEKEIGFSFCTDYKRMLKVVSNILYGTIELLCLSKDKIYSDELISTLHTAREQGLAKNWLPFCEDNGNYYCINSDGIIKYWSHNGYTNEQWPNLASWIHNV
ncbi:SMI1/KNR4 family protein [Acinetobacter rathckeae]|uniref:SMI1/KNR4 family protein n=1 Tax=Acinetobacter rathckeae TaxID=2605272 RepID=UPI0018A2F3BF|nr:SMI1/KNR4 family protein [Acinetobacter rathckeae]MBF7686690.1 SMI1/KNR4 family protein [Acinetobacter rathckeae]MBF7696507.1 SMI1/KNR4 family protein [Acinetobacter rathckeae]